MYCVPFVLAPPFWFEHYENTPMQYTEIFGVVKNLKFHQNLFLLKTRIVGTSLNRLGEAVLTSTHNLCFGATIRKIGIPVHTPVLLYKSGVQEGIHYTDMFSLLPTQFIQSESTCQSRHDCKNIDWDVQEQRVSKEKDRKIVYKVK